MEAAVAYKKLIDALVLWSGSAPLLHVHAGLAIYLLTQVTTRHRRSWIIGLNIVFAAEAGNELLDWMIPDPRWTLHDTLTDVLLTMMWPVAIATVTQYRRRRWARTSEQTTRRAASPPRAGARLAG